MPHSPSHARRKPPRLFPALTVTVATAALTGSVLAAAGPAGATTAEPAVTVRAVHAGQLWETHRHHEIHMARAARGYYSAVSPVRSGDTEPDGDSDDRASGAASAPVSTGGSGFQACVIARESGGNPRAVNPSSGAGGLYQFLPSTWQSLGYSGLPENASVATQTQAFWQLYAQQGAAPWSPSDHC